MKSRRNLNALRLPKRYFYISSSYIIIQFAQNIYNT